VGKGKRKSGKSSNAVIGMAVEAGETKSEKTRGKKWGL